LDRGYVEERREGADGPLQFFNRHVGAMNVISLDTFHRTILFDEKAGSWSLFCMGPRVRKWGFLQSDGTIQRANHFDARTGESVPRS
jgi:hypothetical protein